MNVLLNFMAIDYYMLSYKKLAIYIVINASSLINLIGKFLWYANLLAKAPFEVRVATNVGDNRSRSSDQFLMMELEKTLKQKTFTR